MNLLSHLQHHTAGLLDIFRLLIGQRKQVARNIARGGAGASHVLDRLPHLI